MLVHSESPMALQPAGVPFYEPEFGTKITRLVDLADGNHVNWYKAAPEYSNRQSWNSDQTKLLLVNAGYVIIDAVTGATLASLNLNAREAKWSPTNPNVIYYISNYGGAQSKKLYRYTYGAGEVVEKDFSATYSNLYTGSGKERTNSEMSDDGTTMALMGLAADGHWEVFTYNVVTGAQSPGLDVYDINVAAGESPASANDVEWAFMMPSGRYVCVLWMNNGYNFPNGKGICAYDADTMAYAGHVFGGSSHCCFTVDEDGNDWLVSDSVTDSSGPLSGGRYVKARVPDGTVYKPDGVTPDWARTYYTPSDPHTVILANMSPYGFGRGAPYGWGDHKSGTNYRMHGKKGNWVLITSDATVPSNFPPENQPYQIELFRLYLDSTLAAPHVDRLAHYRCSPAANYWYYGSISPDGRMAIFGSDWRRGARWVLYGNYAPIEPYIMELIQ